MDFSIVIPAYRESAKIGRDVEAAGAFLDKMCMSGEVIVVDDGSDDGTAGQARIAPLPRGIGRHIIHYEPNRGKGHAVRRGILASRGEYVMFADSGLCVLFDYALLGLELIRAGQCELAHGTRKSRQSRIRRHQPFHRRAGSMVFRFLISHMGVPGDLTDTQCGFKVYRGDVAREVYARCVTDGFMFDVEVLLRALQRGYRVQEFPVQWHHDPDTRLRPVKTALQMIPELWRIHQALKNR